MPKIKTSSLASVKEQENRDQLFRLYQENPIPSEEVVGNTGLFLKRQELTKMLFFNELYQQVSRLHGVIMEFGCRWGQNLVTLNNLRGIHEPYNYNRKIIGFDTFEGFKNTSGKDGKHEIIGEGNFSVTGDYQEYLEQVLQAHENECPLHHIPKNMILRGDATQSLQEYLDKNPQTIVAMTWFDLDIYRPTLECLELLKPFLAKGAILGFDELNDPNFPGETLALKEFANLNSLQVRRNKFSGMQSYIIFE